MYQTFLAIISLLAAGYCFFTKQVRIGLGYLVYTIAFVLLMPKLTVGIESDIASAGAMVLFVGGSLIIIWKKKVAIPSLEKPEEENK